MHAGPPHEPPLRFRDRIRNAWRTFIRAIAPSRVAWRGASLAIIAVTLFVWLSMAFDVMTESSWMIPLAVCLLIITVAVVASGLVVLALALLARSPVHFRWALFAGVVLLYLAFTFIPISGLARLTLVAISIVTAALVGGGIASLAFVSWPASSLFRRASAVTCAVLGIGSVAAVGYWVVNGGSPRPEIT